MATNVMKALWRMPNEWNFTWSALKEFMVFFIGWPHSRAHAQRLREVRYSGVLESSEIAYMVTVTYIIF